MSRFGTVERLYMRQIWANFAACKITPMKRILTLVAAAAALLSASGAPLTPQQALERVTATSKNTLAMGVKVRAPRPVMTGTAADGQPTYYVFTDEECTLFVSADDVATPLLGYTDTGDFDSDSMPPQLRWWLGEYSRQIEWASACGIPVEPARSTTSGGIIPPMLATAWDQGKPYNQYCPAINGEQTVTGCVATAMAQVMYYHQWPVSSVPAISCAWNGQTLTSPSTTLAWNTMLKSYNGSYTTAQASAVARLMQLAGYSVNMKYGVASTGGSSANYVDARNALVTTFGYDVGAELIYRDYYSDAEWEGMVYDDLKNVGPVLYEGRDATEGHAFVCDGYDGNGKFHINWGWGGSSDGYFALSALDPSSLGIGGGNGGYNYNQGAILGLRKPVPGSELPPSYVYCSGEPTATTSLRSIVFMATGDNGGYYTTSYADSPFTYGAKLVNDATGDETYAYSGIIDHVLKPGYGFRRFTVGLPDDLPDGTYSVYPAYQYNGGDWNLVRIKYGLRQCLTVTVNGTCITLPQSETMDPADLLWLKSCRIDAGFAPDESFDLSLTICNTYSEPKSMTITARLSIFDPEINSWRGYAALGTQTVDIPADSQAAMRFSGILDKIDAGRYDLVFVADGYVIGYVPVLVGGSAAIDGVEVDRAPVRYFNLHGVEVGADALTEGVYIRICGSQTTKVLIK